jgi:hypothetical protein
MFYLLKNLLLLILVIFQLKCNNLILNGIIVLNASYVCLHAFSLHRESPNLDPGRWTPHFRGGSVTPTPFYCVCKGPPLCLLGYYTMGLKSWWLPLHEPMSSHTTSHRLLTSFPAVVKEKRDIEADLEIEERVC